MLNLYTIYYQIQKCTFHALNFVLIKKAQTHVCVQCKFNTEPCKLNLDFDYLLKYYENWLVLPFNNNLVNHQISTDRLILEFIYFPSEILNSIKIAFKPQFNHPQMKSLLFFHCFKC